MSSTDFTNSWDNTEPDGSEDANTIDDLMRKLRTDVDERFNPMFVGFNSTSGTVYGCKHIRFLGTASIPAAVTGTSEGFLFGTNSDGTNMGLSWKPTGAGGQTIVEIVKKGVIPGASIGTRSIAGNKIRLQGTTGSTTGWIMGTSGGGQGRIKLIGISTHAVETHGTFVPMLGSGVMIWGTSAPVNTYSVVTKKYVDAVLDTRVGTSNITPLAFGVGVQSQIFPNGFIMKGGYIAGSGTRSIVFGTAFPGAALSMTLTDHAPGAALLSGGNNSKISTLSAGTALVWVNNDEDVDGAYWMATGY